MIHEVGALVTRDTEKVVTATLCLSLLLRQESQTFKITEETRRKDFSTAEEDWRSVKPNEHPQICGA